MPDRDVEHVKQEILDYLRKHPDASDDLEGITRFWVTKQRIEAAIATVERAVNDLVGEGRLEKKVQRAGGGQSALVRYQLGRDNKDPS